MRKGERTRRMIVERSAPVFNTNGYFGTSMSDLVRKTGLEKGGIYNHFASKEELALETFEFAVGIMRERYREALSNREGALELLFAVIDVLGGLVENPPVAGGCPILNTAIEADDTNPPLKEKAREAMSGWHRLIGKITKDGVESGELSSQADPYEMASIITSTLEGALMLSKLFDNPIHMKRAVEHLKGHLRTLAQDPKRAKPQSESV